MLSALLRFAREGSMLAVLGVSLLSAPLAHAQPREREGRRDPAPSVGNGSDRGEPGVLDYGRGLAGVFDPRHDLGKLALGGLLLGAAPAVALIPPPVGIVAAIGVGAIGAGLMAWGAWNINKVAKAPVEPTRPTTGTTTGGTTTNGGTTTSPGNVPGNGGNPTTNDNGGRGIPTRVDPPGGIDLGGSNVSRNDDTTLSTRIPRTGRPSRTSSGTGGGATR